MPKVHYVFVRALISVVKDLTFGLYEGDPSDDEDVVVEFEGAHATAAPGGNETPPVRAPSREEQRTSVPVEHHSQPAANNEPTVVQPSGSLRDALLRDAQSIGVGITVSDTLGDDVSSHAAHSQWFVRLILVLVVFLNVRWHLPHRACAILLFALRTIFIAVNLLQADDPMPTTLKTAYKRLNWERGNR